MDVADEAADKDEKEAEALHVDMLERTQPPLGREPALMSRSNNKKATRSVHWAQEPRVVDVDR